MNKTKLFRIIMVCVEIVIIITAVFGACAIIINYIDQSKSPALEYENTKLGEPLFQEGQVLYENQGSFVEKDKVVDAFVVSQGGEEYWLYVLENSPNIYFTEEQMIKKFGLPE